MFKTTSFADVTIGLYGFEFKVKGLELRSRSLASGPRPKNVGLQLKQNQHILHDIRYLHRGPKSQQHLFVITSANTSRVSRFFHWHTQQ